jgi:hypothetical protein
MLAQLRFNGIFFHGGAGVQYANGKWALSDETIAAYESINFAISEDISNRGFHPFFVLGVGFRIFRRFHMRVEHQNLWQAKNRFELVGNRSIIHLRDITEPTHDDVEILVRLPTLRFGFGYVF